ncbi:phage holin family protein [Brevibacillus ginsengisoli]|uniref:phage holin family protein n=1 Tax=Brevibacillus ginsengisoli TaxID=363854 RepID=UPI003CF81492
MIRWIIRVLLNAGALLLISHMFTSIYIDNFGTAVWAAIILGLVNTLIRPVLVTLTLPLTFLTLGIFWFFVNALTFALTAYLIDGFELGPWPQSFITTMVAAAFMSFFGSIIHWLTKKVD